MSFGGEGVVAVLGDPNLANALCIFGVGLPTEVVMRVVGAGPSRVARGAAVRLCSMPLVSPTLARYARSR